MLATMLLKERQSFHLSLQTFLNGWFGVILIKYVKHMLNDWF